MHSVQLIARVSISISSKRLSKIQSQTIFLDVVLDVGERESRAAGWFSTFEALEVAVELAKDSDILSTSSGAAVLELRRALRKLLIMSFELDMAAVNFIFAVVSFDRCR